MGKRPIEESVKRYEENTVKGAIRAYEEGRVSKKWLMGVLGYKPQSAILIADYFLANTRPKSLSPLMVNKLVYLAHGYTLALYDISLIVDKVEAWKYGPVIPSLFYTMHNYGDNKIDKLLYCNTYTKDPTKMADRKEFLGKNLHQYDKILDMIIKTYSSMDITSLLGIMHAKDTPWYKYYKTGKYGVKIPDKMTQKYFKKVLEID